jgi:curved DNA-binding protein CbpA
MTTLYDLLGVPPDDDVEGLKNAFRKAVKASHPDLHAGDPDAPMRFRHIVRAYAILRDPEQRLAYDRLLAFEREQLRSKSKRTISYTMRNFVCDAIVVAGLTVVMAGGYTLFADISRPAVVAVNVVEVPARGPAKIAAIQPARTVTTDRDKPREKPVRVGVREAATAPSAVASEANARGTANREPALSSAGRDTEIAKIVNAFGTPIDRAETKAAADHLKKTYRVEPPDQNKALPVGVQVSSPEKGNGVPKSSSSDLTISDEKSDLKTRDIKTPKDRGWWRNGKPQTTRL